MSPFRITLLSHFFLFISVFSYSQEKTGACGEVNPSIRHTKWLYLTFNDKSFYCKLNLATAISIPDPVIYIIGDTVCKNESRAYLVVRDTSLYMMNTGDFINIGEIEEELKRIKKSYPELELRKRLAIQYMSFYLREANRHLAVRKEQEEILNQKTQDSIQKEVDRYVDSIKKHLDKTLITFRENNWVLWNWSWGYSNEYSKFVDVDITVINPYKQRIKYIWFTFIAFNPVGDPVRHAINGKSEVTVQGIGPIEYRDKGTYNFEDVFYSKVIDKMRIKQIKIQFFDGTYKTIANPKNLDAE